MEMDNRLGVKLNRKIAVESITMEEEGGEREPLWRG